MSKHVCVCVCVLEYAPQRLTIRTASRGEAFGADRVQHQLLPRIFLDGHVLRCHAGQYVLEPEFLAELRHTLLVISRLSVDRRVQDYVRNANRFVDVSPVL